MKKLVFLFLIFSNFVVAQRSPNSFNWINGFKIQYSTVSEGWIADVVNEGKNTNPYNLIGGRATYMQYGWQFETYYALGNHVKALSEWNVNLGAIFKGRYLFETSSCFVFRINDKFEFGSGLNWSYGGRKWMHTIGYIIDFNNNKFPVNLSYIPSEHGNRTSLSLGILLK